MALLAFAGVARAQAPGDTAARDAGWRSDLKLLVGEARRAHASPARPAHSAAFAQAADDLARRIPELSDRRIAVELQRLLAMLGDGHSLVYAMPTARISFAMLPLDLYLFSDGLFVVDGRGEAAGLVGSRITHFGPRTTAEALEAMAPYVSRDNDMALKSFVGLYPVLPAFLEAWGATRDTDRVRLTLVDAGGGSRVVELLAGPARRFRKRLFAPANASAPAPLYLLHPHKAYWMQDLPRHDALYFQFNQVGDAPDLALRDFAARLRARLADGAADTLVVDVRHNGGGNNMLLEPLLRTIEDFARGGPGRGVYVITGRATFSAAQNFINRLERRVPGATFAGEPSMSSPNFTGEDNPVSLPFSGLSVSISNRHWQDSAADDTRPWIAPHLTVELSSRDWLENRDPVLDAVLRDISAKRTPQGAVAIGTLR